MRRNLIQICCVSLLLVFLSEASYASVNDIHKTWTENQPPNPPVITGPTMGNANTQYYYDFYLTDPDGDYLKTILIEWGGLDSDNTTYICWLCEGGPLPNGSTFEYFHDWGATGTYTIRAKVWDLQDNESDWGTLTVTMPYSSHEPIPHFFEVLFQRFPNAFPFLRHIMGY